MAGRAPSTASPSTQASAPVDTRSVETPSTAVVATSISYFDVLLLRLTDLFLWCSPQLTLGLAALYALGGKIGTGQDPYLSSWAGVLFFTLCAAIPLTTGQRRRRDLESARRVSTWTCSGGCEKRHRRGLVFSALRDDDQYRLDVIARSAERIGKIVSSHGEEGATRSSRGVESFGAFLRAHMGLLVVVSLVSALMAAAPAWVSLSYVADCCLAPCCLLVLCVTGAAIAVVEPLREAAAYRAQRMLAAKAQPSFTKDGGFTDGGERLIVDPAHVAQALRLRRLAAHPHLRGAGAPARYALPSVHEKEAAALEQLLNFGAPFSTVLLKPLRLWNARLATSGGGGGGGGGGSARHSRHPSARLGSLSDVNLGSVVQEGWRTLWERDGLRCEVKDASLPAAAAPGATPTTVITATRMVVNVPNANVGSLQAILLDDPDGTLDATKETFAYDWDPLLVERRVVKQLSYDVSVVRTVSKSAAHGVPLTETTQIVSSAVLLDYEQQAALKIYRPFGRRRRGKKLVSSATRGLRVFLSCAVPCPAALHESTRAPTATRPGTASTKPYAVDVTSLTIGLEEVDGSLSLGMLVSLNSAAEATPYPSIWSDVIQHDIAHRIERLASLLRTVGPQENEIAVYKNERGFQPYLLRQAFSERVKVEKVAAASMAAAAAATASVNWLDQHRKSTRFADDAEEDAVGGEAAAVVPFTDSSVRFIKELIASPAWKSVCTRHGAQVLTTTKLPDRTSGDGAAVALRSGRAVQVRVFIPRATLPIVDDVLRRAELASVYDPFVEQRVNVTVLQAAELLAQATPDVVDDSGNTVAPSGGTSKQSADAPSPRSSASLDDVSAELAAQRRQERTVQWLRVRPPALGGLGVLFLPPRDYVLGVSNGEYFTADELFSTKRGNKYFGENVFRLFPDIYRELPAKTRMFVRCGEDVSGLLPPLEGVRRGHVRMSGVLCWETTAGEVLKNMKASQVDAPSTNDAAMDGLDPQEKGVMLVRCFVTDPGGWMPSCIWTRSLQEELDNAVQFRKLVSDAVAGSTAV